MKFTRIAAFITAAAMAAALSSCGTGKKTEGVTTEGLDENGHFLGVKASEVVTLPEYKGIEIEKSVVTVTDEDLQKQIDIILESNQSYEKITEGTVEDGATVNIDYVGYVDGVAFEGGNTNGAGTTVTIGVTSYIDGFLDQLIGHSVGDSFDINVTFPDPYQNNPDLSGKAAVFKTTINYIQGEAIKVELTDEIAKQYGFQNVDDLKADISEWLLMSQAFTVYEEIAKNVTCENVPESVIEYMQNLDVQQYEYYAEAYNITVDEFIAQYTEYETLDAYFEANAETYKENAIFYLTAQAIAEIENLSVTTEYIEASNYAPYIESYGEAYLKQFLLLQEVVPTFIVENAKVAE